MPVLRVQERVPIEGLSYGEGSQVVFINGESMEWGDSSGSVWAIDEKTRIVYVAHAKSLIRIPFETIKKSRR